MRSILLLLPLGNIVASAWRPRVLRLMRRLAIERAALLLALVLLFIVSFTALSLLAALAIVPGTRSLEFFSYPLDVDLVAVVDAQLSGRKLPVDVWPVNVIPRRLLIDSPRGCASAQLVVLVKTVHEARANRMAIRQTWGRADCLPSLRMRTLFLLGTHSRNTDEEDHLRAEQSLHHDILQFDFVDAYQHNTYKFLAGMRYAVTRCPNATNIVMIDDDYLLNPWRLAEFLNKVHPVQRARLVAGYVFYGALPKRDLRSKWYVSLEDYPYAAYPAYPTAGTVVMSREMARNLSVAAQYVRYISFDDVFLGIVLHKLNLLPMHSRLMRKADDALSAERLSHYISSHGYRNADNLRRGWHMAGFGRRCAADGRSEHEERPRGVAAVPSR